MLVIVQSMRTFRRYFSLSWPSLPSRPWRRGHQEVLRRPHQAQHWCRQIGLFHQKATANKTKSPKKGSQVGQDLPKRLPRPPRSKKVAKYVKTPKKAAKKAKSTKEGYQVGKDHKKGCQDLHVVWSSQKGRDPLKKYPSNRPYFKHWSWSKRGAH